MPDLRHLRQVSNLPLTGAKAKAPLYPLQVGMPALDSIHQDITFTPKGLNTSYRILRTTETDTYEKTDAAAGFAAALSGQKVPAVGPIMAAAKRKPSTGDNYAGKDRKAAKLSISNAKTDKFSDLSKLIATLPSRADMVKLKIPTTPDSGRVAKEERNIRVTGFLYAASRESDNDFHLIVGRNPKASGPAMYMTMEVSGLPPSNSAAFQKLNAARTSFKNFFGNNPARCRIRFLQSQPNSGSDRGLAVLGCNSLHGASSWTRQLEAAYADDLGGPSDNVDQTGLVIGKDMRTKQRRKRIANVAKKSTKQRVDELDQLRPGMPAKDSIQEVREGVSPDNFPYTILRTNEMDAYDPPPQKGKKRKP